MKGTQITQMKQIYAGFILILTAMDKGKDAGNKIQG